MSKMAKDFRVGSKDINIPKVPAVKDEPLVNNPQLLEVPEKPKVPKPKMGVIYMDKAKTLIFQILKGEGKLGQIIFGVLETFGLGALLDLFRSYLKKVERNRGEWFPALAQQAQKIKWLRLLMSVYVAYMVMNGNVPWQEAAGMIEMIWQFSLGLASVTGGG